MTWLAWRTLRWHPGSLIGTLITLVVAATAVGSLWFVVDATDRQEVPVERYAGVPLVVGTTGGAISPGLVAAVKALPEVAATVPEHSFPAGLSARGTPVRVPGDQNPWPWGHGWSSARLTPFQLRDGRPPRARGEVVVDARLAAAAQMGIGDRVEITVAGTIRPHKVVGVAAAGTAWRYQSALFFADGHVAELIGGRRGADALGVHPGRASARKRCGWPWRRQWSRTTRLACGSSASPWARAAASRRTTSCPLRVSTPCGSRCGSRPWSRRA
ncbi:ABC transporter permease [Nonomuraea rubra]|uniref:ABC transporter permease n=1 Tax=Nonomuraea rubra TaxID=46180 RepID=UPI00360AFA9A